MSGRDLWTTSDDIPLLPGESELPVAGVAGVTRCLIVCFFDCRDIVLPLLTPFITWLRITFRERRSMAELSMNWNGMAAHYRLLCF